MRQQHPIKYRYEVVSLNSDGTKTLVREGDTEGTEITVGGLAAGWYLLQIATLRPDGSRSAPVRLPIFVRTEGGSISALRDTAAQAAAVRGAHVQ